MKVSVPLPFRLIVPSGSTTGVAVLMGWPLTAVMLRLSPSTSLSLLRGSKVTTLSSATVTWSGLAVGLSLTGVMPMVTVDEAVPPCPSSTNTVKLSLPW